MSSSSSEISTDYEYQHLLNIAQEEENLVTHSELRNSKEPERAARQNNNSTSYPLNQLPIRKRFGRKLAQLATENAPATKISSPSENKSISVEKWTEEIQKNSQNVTYECINLTQGVIRHTSAPGVCLAYYKR